MSSYIGEKPAGERLRLVCESITVQTPEAKLALKHASKREIGDAITRLRRSTQFRVRRYK